MPFSNPGGRGAPGGRGPPLQLDGGGSPQPQRPNPQQVLTNPKAGAGELKTYTESQCWQCGEVGHLKKGCPLLKGQGAVTRGECLNSPTSPSHSPTIS